MATENDKEVLNAIFDPFFPNGSLQFDENLPEDDPDTEEVETDDVIEAKKLEVDGIHAAEQKNYELALECLGKAILKTPQRPSAYNNRAQILRLLKKTEEAKQDLTNAINLSQGKGKAASQAHCQRGLIALKESRTEDAKVDFETAAALGSQFAKAQLVQMNPYAALCNAMLRNVYDKLQQGLPTDLDDLGTKCNK